MPILVHLFDFRKARQLYFSSIKYIAKLTTKTKSKSRLKYLLILSNRILIFLAIAALIGILLDKKSAENLDGLIGVHYDNSISSVIDDSSIQVENELRKLSGQFGTFIYFDNLDKSLIEKKSEISLTSAPSPKAQSWKLLLERFEKSGISSHYLFSDFQNTNSSELTHLLRDSSKSYNLVLTNDLNRFRNVSVDSLYLVPNQDNLSEISIFVMFNVSNMQEGSIVVKLMHRSRQLSSVVIDVTEFKEVRFDVSKDIFGDFEIVIDGDDVNYDNTFHFSVGERVKPRITILNSSNSSILQAVYDNQELFEVDIQPLNNLDFDAIQTSDLIVISNQYAIPEIIKNLTNFNFIVFPADSVDLFSYEKFLNVSLNTIDENISETSIDSEHPLLKGVFERRVKDQSLSVDGALFQVKGSFESIIKFRGGNPFLFKKNNIFFFNSSLNQSSGGIQSNALFLPILFQIAFTSVGTIETPYYFPGDRIFVSTKPSDIPIKLIKENYEVIPSFNSIGNQTVLELPEDLEAGKYQLVQGDDIIRGISINFPKSESIMAAPDFDEMNKAFAGMKNVKVIKMVNGNDNVIFAGGSQSSLWKYTLILVVFLLLTETVLHRYLR